jgi:ABC-type polysaccharide/polyol phosphate export permease
MVRINNMPDKANRMSVGGANNTIFLLAQLALSDFKLRYNNSVLGYLWSLLNPLMVFGVYYLVFSVFMRFEGIAHYQLYLLLGILLWNYFAESTTSGMASIQYKASLISKINFPKWMIVVASNLTSTLTLMINLVIFSVFFVVSGASFLSGIIFFPIYLVQLVVFSLGVSFILSSYYLKYRDLMHIWGILIQAFFWLTPIIYPINIIPENIRRYFMLNPMARIIDGSRSVLIYGGMPERSGVIVASAVIAAILLAGMAVFSRRSRKFAEEI